jgi:MFS family permease
VSVIAEFRALDRRNWYLAGARMVVSAGFAMVLPFMAVHLTLERQQPATVAGIIAALAGLCGAAMQWVAGTLSDRVGRRSVMQVSMVVRAANLALLGYVTAIRGPIWVIGLLIVANGVLRAFFDPVANALVADLSPPEQRVAAFSLQRVGVNIGWSVGTLSHGLAGYSTLFYWAAGITLLATLVVTAIVEPPRSTTARPPAWREMVRLLDNPVLVRFLVATVAFFILQVQLYQTLSVYAATVLGLTRAQVGTLYSLNGVMVVLLQVPTVAFIRRWGTERALVLGSIAYASSYAAVGLAGGYVSLLLCVACVTLAEMLSAPAQQTAITSMATPGRMGIYAGLFGLCQVTGQSAGPLVGSALLDLLMPSRVAHAAWFILALFGVAAAAIYRTQDKRPVPAERVGPQ